MHLLCEATHYYSTVLFSPSLKLAGEQLTALKGGGGRRQKCIRGLRGKVLRRKEEEHYILSAVG